MSHGNDNISERKVRNNVIPIRYTEPEKTALVEKSKAHNLSISEFVRRSSLARKMPRQAVPEINRKTYLELCRIGNNLNQITRNFNTSYQTTKRMMDFLE